jgi:uncharacterized protein YvpB
VSASAFPSDAPTQTAALKPTSRPATMQPTAEPISIPPTAVPTLPVEAHIEAILGQTQTLPLSCESRSAVDWAGFFGVPIQELAFQGRLPVSDDPDLGFVGDSMGVWGNIPPRAYGVHAEPVAALLQDYGLPAEARRNMTLAELKAEIADGRPVITWVVGHVTSGTPQVYTSRAGRQVTVAAREHTVIVTGYTPEVIFVLDGGWVYARATQHFINSWGALGNMAVVYGSP